MSPKVRVSRKLPQRHAERLATRRKKRRAVLGVVAFIGLLGIIGGSVYVMHLPAFRIQSIEVVGAHDVSTTAIKKYVESVLDDGRFHIFSPRTIFAYPKISITAGLRTQFPRLNTVTLARPTLASTALVITVTERVPYGVWCREGDIQLCYDMDATGFIYTEDQLATSSGYVVLHGGVIKPESPIGLYVAPEHFEEVKELLAQLTTNLFQVQTFSMLDEKDFDIGLADGVHVRGSFEYPVGEIVSNLMLAMTADTLRTRRADLEYIDLRFGNRVYYRFK